MNAIEKLEKEIQASQDRLEVIKDAVAASKKILELSKNENLRLRAQACLQELGGINSRNEDIGYDLENTHECVFGQEKKGWMLDLTDEEFEMYKMVIKGFDEVDFIMSNTKYDNYDTGFFFRRS